MCASNAQVLGNCKGVFAAIVSVALYKNPVTLEGWGGYAITIIGTVLYSEVRMRGLGYFDTSQMVPTVLRVWPPYTANATLCSAHYSIAVAYNPQVVKLVVLPCC